MAPTPPGETAGMSWAAALDYVESLGVPRREAVVTIGDAANSGRRVSTAAYSAEFRSDGKCYITITAETAPLASPHA